RFRGFGVFQGGPVAPAQIETELRPKALDHGVAELNCYVAGCRIFVHGQYQPFRLHSLTPHLISASLEIMQGQFSPVGAWSPGFSRPDEPKSCCCAKGRAGSPLPAAFVDGPSFVSRT